MPDKVHCWHSHMGVLPCHRQGLLPAGRHHWHCFMVRPQRHEAQCGQYEGYDHVFLQKAFSWGHSTTYHRRKGTRKITCAKVLGAMLSSDLSCMAGPHWLHMSQCQQVMVLLDHAEESWHFSQGTPHFLQSISEVSSGVCLRCLAYWSDWRASRPHWVCAEEGTVHLYMPVYVRGYTYPAWYTCKEQKDVFSIHRFHSRPPAVYKVKTIMWVFAFHTVHFPYW